MAILSKTNEGLSALCSAMKPFLYDDEMNLTYFYSGKHGLQQEEISSSDMDRVIYHELYPTIDIAKLREQFDSSKERILILYGEPGVGKTTFLQYLIADGFYKKVAYIKDKKTFEDSELWYELTDDDWDLIVFDDLDDILQSRSENKHADFVSQLLSYSDGLIRRSTKIVITTNQNVQEIDPAITRPGRCFDFLVLPPLTRSQARDAWTTLLKQSSDSYDARFGEAETVTQAALMSEYFQVVSDYTERSYIKVGERSYSIRQKLEELGIASGSRKAGFGGR
jgi:SpoVK/Ycf46/Vps4 family AAA+-type ATPase